MSNLSLILSHGYAAGLFSDFAILLQEADETGIGSLQDPPWHKRPSTVEENLVQFSLCQSYCPSDYWEIDSQAENRSNSALQQENLQELAETAGSLLQTQLSRLDISFEPGIMAHLGNNLGLQDIMKNLRRVYELTAIGVKESREIAKEIKEMSDTVSRTSQEVSNNGARTDDLESNLLELLGRVERIEEDLQNLVSMNQESRVNGVNDPAPQPMEEESVQQPRPQRGK